MLKPTLLRRKQQQRHERQYIRKREDVVVHSQRLNVSFLIQQFITFKQQH